ncbi:MAG: NADH-quinone oxidoreductase subunit N [Verrucomicrobiales bacterium]|nr:NADH-quinone oxidoreductase subunit N [Verrucomicrobiales bacterium]
MNFLDLARIASPEIALVLGALAALALDLAQRGRGDGRTRTGAVWAGVAGCAAAVVLLGLGVAGGAAPGGMLANGPVVQVIKMVLATLTAGTLLLSVRGGFTTHVGEYVATVMLGGVGMMLIASSENVLMMFLALELASVSLYILTGFNKRDPRSSEAALKYFLFGGMAGAFLLFGLSLIYGATGAIEFQAIRARLAGQSPQPLMLAGLVMVLVGLGFKVAAAPFHFWAPDAYEGAPTPAAGFIAAGSKVAAFFILAKLTGVALDDVSGRGTWGDFAAGWAPLLAVMAAASMVWGNLAALRQRNVKRLLAYSAVAHGGYTIVAMVAGGSEVLPAVCFYAVTYAFTTLGAFGVAGWVESKTGGTDFQHFAGLTRRSPVAALCLGVFILSLAGIPPLAGFFGKFYLFLVALNGDAGALGLLWLVGLGAATTCVSFYYYLRVLKAVFVDEIDPELTPAGDRGGDTVELATIVAAAVLVVVAGCAPSLFLNPLGLTAAVTP